MKLKIAWNKAGTASVVLNKLKEFTIDADVEGKQVVRGWYNKENFFVFGKFDTKEAAKEFLQGIHNQCEGGGKQCQNNPNIV